MTVAILVDSAAALPEELVARHRLHVVPLELVVGDETYADGELGLPELLDRLGEGVSTSAPSPGVWLEAIESLDDEVDAVLVLTVSAEMSASFRSARMAADAVDLETRVLDTTTAAGAEGLVALAAAEAAQRGESLDECRAVAERIAGEVRLVATLQDLGRLAASGRVPAVAAWAGKQLDVNPLFEFRDGEAHALRPAFSRDAALDRIARSCLSDRPDGATRLHAVALHADAPDAAERLLRAVGGDEGDVLFHGPFSPVMVAHTGRGLAGLAWWWE